MTVAMENILCPFCKSKNCNEAQSKSR